MNTVKLTDVALLTPCQYFDFSNPPFEPIEFAKQLAKTMIDSGGIGLAANQVGVPYAIFAIRGSPENVVVFNPKIVYYSPESTFLEEGCLSYPGLIINVQRAKEIRVRYQQPNGQTITTKFTGLTSKVFQHEFLHLQGKPFWEGVSKFQFDLARRRSGWSRMGQKVFIDGKKVLEDVKTHRTNRTNRTNSQGWWVQ